MTRLVPYLSGDADSVRLKPTVYSSNAERALVVRRGEVQFSEKSKVSDKFT
jgi:hypothetical protein